MHFARSRVAAAAAATAWTGAWRRKAICLDATSVIFPVRGGIPASSRERLEEISRRGVLHPIDEAYNARDSLRGI